MEATKCAHDLAITTRPYTKGIIGTQGKRPQRHIQSHEEVTETHTYSHMKRSPPVIRI